MVLLATNHSGWALKRVSWRERAWEPRVGIFETAKDLSRLVFIVQAQWREGGDIRAIPGEAQAQLPQHLKATS